ncbi:MAG: hypothetical protein G01um101493_143, partial [Microgenomates group bacterium Gr01-1014_93]
VKFKYFGPGDWQSDSTPEALAGRWNEALAILRAAKANPKAQELYQQFSTHLLNCIKIATSWVGENDRKDLSNVLEKSHMRLEDITLH